MPKADFLYPPIGIAGAARAGKDTLCRGLIRKLNDVKIDAVRKSIAGDLVKQDLKDILIEKFNIDSFTEDSDLKNFIRPLLVEYGKMQRNKSKGRYFIDAFKRTPLVVNILPDIRYVEYSRDEVYWLKNEVKGFLIFIKRKNIDDANDTERVNNKIIKNMADYILEWDTLKEKNPEDILQIDSYAKWIIDQYYIPMVYSATTCQ
jgi:hypothetical protein